MNQLPDIDFAVAWSCIPPETQARIGAAAIKANFLMFASGEWQGDEEGEGVTYFDAERRDEISEAAGRALADMGALIEPEFPDLFGENPSAAHPYGTDPTWATPIRRPVCPPD